MADTMNGADGNGVSSPTISSKSPSAGTTTAAAAAASTTNGSSLPAPAASGGGGGDLLDLDDIFGGGGGSTAGTGTAPAGNAAAAPAVPTGSVGVLGAGLGATSGPATGTGGSVDLLADIFASSPGLATTAATGSVAAGAGVAPVAPGAVEDDGFGGFEVAPPKDDTMVVRCLAWLVCHVFFALISISQVRLDAIIIAPCRCLSVFFHAF